jgi:hypothetical protein
MGRQEGPAIRASRVSSRSRIISARCAGARLNRFWYVSGTAIRPDGARRGRSLGSPRALRILSGGVRLPR